jgi:hypothetical protein
VAIAFRDPFNQARSGVGPRGQLKVARRGGILEKGGDNLWGESS